MSNELAKYSYYYDRRTAVDSDYRSYMEKRAAVEDVSAAIKQSSNRQITANAVMGGLLANKMERMQTGIQNSIRAQTYTLVASQAVLQQTFQEGFDKVNNTLDMGFAGVSNQLGMMSVAFAIGLANVERSIDRMSKEICDRLDAIHDILNNPLLTQSRELYRRSLINYNKGFYEEALEDIKGAVEKNKTDYISWFLLGKVCLFGASEFSNVINLDTAIEAFIAAAKYIKPDITEIDEARLMAAEIWFYLGLARYTKSNDLLFVDHGDEAALILTDAQNAYDRSWSYSDKMLESLYNVARCKALSGDTTGALESLKTVILIDRNYCLKVCAETDFDSIQDEYQNMIKEMKQKIFENIKEYYQTIVQYNKEAIESGIKDQLATKNAIDEGIDEGIKDMESIPYFDMLDRCKDFKSLKESINSDILRTKENNAKTKAAKIERDRIDAIKEEIQGKIAEYKNICQSSRVFTEKEKDILYDQQSYFKHLYENKNIHQSDRSSTETKYLSDTELEILHKRQQESSRDIKRERFLLAKNAESFNIPNIRSRWEPILKENRGLLKEIKEASYQAYDKAFSYILKVDKLAKFGTFVCILIGTIGGIYFHNFILPIIGLVVGLIIMLKYGYSTIDNEFLGPPLVLGISSIIAGIGVQNFTVGLVGVIGAIVWFGINMSNAKKPYKEPWIIKFLRGRE